MAVSALAQLLDQQPTAYAEVLAACRAMGWNASPTAQPQDIIDELPSNVLPFIRRMLALLIYGDGSADSPAVVPVTERCYAQMLARQASPNYPAAGFPTAPSALSPMTPSIRDFAHLPQALSALSARKISGVPEAPDGISLVHLLADRSGITKLTDDNTWSDGVTFSTTQQLVSLFPNLTSIELGIKELTFDSNNGAFTSSNLTEIKLPHLEVYNGNGLPPGYYSAIVYGTQIEELDLSSLREINRIASWKSNPCQIAYNCSTLKVVDLSSMTSFLTGMDSGYPGVHFQDCPNIETIKVGKVTSFNSQNFTQYTATDPMTKLVHLEFGDGTAISLNLAYWNPTYALQNQLSQFLQNFRDYIALRLTDNGSGKTLTLSQAVYTAVIEGSSEICTQIKSIISDKHWKVTDGTNIYPQ